MSRNTFVGASYFNKYSFNWLNLYMIRKRNKPLDFSDIMTQLPDMETSGIVDTLEREWNTERQTNPKSPSLMRTIATTFLFYAPVFSLLIVAESNVAMLVPVITEEFLKYFSDEISDGLAVLYVLLICFSFTLIFALRIPYKYLASEYAIKIRSACSGLLYRKMVKLKMSSFAPNTGLHLIQELSDDLTQIEMAFQNLPYLIAGPIQFVFIVVYASLKVDATFLSGLIVLAVIYGLKVAAYIYKEKLTEDTKSRTRERISFLKDMINNIYGIKLHSVEYFYTEDQNKIRDKELLLRVKLNILKAVERFVEVVGGNLATLLNILFFVATSNKPLLASSATYSLAFYLMLCNSAGLNFSNACLSVLKIRSFCTRMEELLLTEIHKDTRAVSKSKHSQAVISVENFSWSSKDKPYEFDVDDLTMRDISFRINKNELTMIYGPAGCGKSRLMLAMAGELENFSGNITISSHRLRIALVSQEMWIFPTTVKENIIYGLSFNKTKFDKIVEVCLLTQDIESFAKREETMIGDIGLNLTHPQRVKINIARALYTEADVFLLDDILTGLDPKLTQELLLNCINGYLHAKTRVVTTSNPNHLSSAQWITILKNGGVEIQGTYEKLSKTAHIKVDKVIEDEEWDEEYVDEKKIEEVNFKQQAMVYLHRPTDMEKENEEEKEIKTRFVDFWTYCVVFAAGWGYLGPLVISGVFIVSQGALMASDYWLFKWASKEEEHTREQDSELIDIFDQRDHYFEVYIILSCTWIGLLALRSSLLHLWCTQNAKRAYECLFASIRDAYMKFFESNPMGRIMRRFSDDTYKMDLDLASNLDGFFHSVLILVGILLLSVITNPWMLFTMIGLLVAFVVLVLLYVRINRQLRLMQQRAKRVLLSHAESSSSCMEIYRSLRQESKLVKEFEELCDVNSRLEFLVLSTNFWFTIRLQLVCLAYILISLITSIYVKESIGLKPGAIGLLVVYLSQMSDYFPQCVNSFITLDNTMTSMRRIKEYAKIATEPIYSGQTTLNRPGLVWPSECQIILQNLSLSYDSKLPSALENVTLLIRSKEKMGIVGKSGSGRTSILNLFTRFYEPTNGIILIDGVNIKSLKLFDLRTHLAVLPQEPILFNGTIRFNVDPFDQNRDEEIWKILEMLDLKKSVESLNGGLNADFRKCSKRFSTEQKKLFCVARAVLKRAKIVLIDDITSQCSNRVNFLIQQAIREQFSDCTVLAVTDKIANIADYNRIMCLSNGRLVKCDEPLELLKDKASVFFELYKNLSVNERRIINELAYESSDNQAQQTPTTALYQYVNKGATI